MLVFELSTQAEAARGRNPAQQFIFGPDETPFVAEFRTETGRLIAESANTDAAGLSVQIDLDAIGALCGESATRLGKLTLTTCLLPHRTEPYSLALELARKRTMQVMTKLEEWGLFDLSTDDPSAQRFEAARQAFTRALVAQRRGAGQPGEAPDEPERLAWLALLRAVEAGERLALLHAQRHWSARMSGETYGRACAHYERVQGERPPEGAPVLVPGTTGVMLPGKTLLGCSVSPAVFSEALGRVVAGACDFVTMPMRWSDLEPTEGKYAFAGTDRWIEWAVRTAKMPVAAGPIIDFRPACVPEWLYIWENDYETLRELALEHVKQVVTRYRRTVRRWTVVSGLHVNSHFSMGFEQIMDLTRHCVLLVRKLHPQANVVVELAQPWGEYYATSRRSVPGTLYADLVNQAAIPVDAFGVRMQMGQPRPGQAVRDLMAMSALMDRLAELERPLLVTALGAPSAPVSAPLGEGTKPGEPRTGADGRLDPGRWHAPWTDALQAEWMAHAVAVLAAKPYVHSVCWQDLYDTPAAPEMVGGGLITQGGAAKPAMLKLAELRRAMREGKFPLGEPALG
jgi:hypothetical protein